MEECEERAGELVGKMEEPGNHDDVNAMREDMQPAFYWSPDGNQREQRESHIGQRDEPCFVGQLCRLRGVEVDRDRRE